MDVRGNDTTPYIHSWLSGLEAMLLDAVTWMLQLTPGLV